MTEPTRTTTVARLHHNAWVTRDQEATRRFYEDLIGLPLIATWSETDELFGAERVYCHTFFGLADGSALAFFQFEKEEDQVLFGPPMPETPFSHIALKVDSATQDGVAERLAAAGYTEPATFVLEHGYCRSLYVRDPNGLLIELTADHPDADAISATRLATAHRDLASWLDGDHTSNNTYR
ncbi:MAG: glyoxalase [Ilumatobacteraceae bacterium]|nr:glyoxalase [Ilumatobacteraceae bacterium]